MSNTSLILDAGKSSSDPLVPDNNFSMLVDDISGSRSLSQDVAKLVKTAVDIDIEKAIPPTCARRRLETIHHRQV